MYEFRKQIEAELQRVKQLLDGLRSFDPELSKETLVGTKLAGGTVSVYSEKCRLVNGVRERIRRPVGMNDGAYAREVAEAKYLARLTRDLNTDRALLEKMLKAFQPYAREDILDKLPAIYSKTIIGDAPVRLFDGRGPEVWAARKTHRNPKEFASRHFAVNGEVVRSKNEALIYNLYWHYGVPVRYEDMLLLKNDSGVQVEVYPDFTILRADGSKMAHEHFGMFGDKRYRENAFEKTWLYLSNGFELWKDLIITFDGAGGSIDTETIDRLIRTFVLPQI